MLKIAVLVSSGGTNLQAIIDAKRNGAIKNGELALVISSNDEAYALTRARNANIKTCIVKQKDFTDRNSFSEAILDELCKNKIDLVVFAGFMFILTGKINEVYKNKMINVHPALIPAFCGKGFYGLRVHEKVLEYGVKITGATVHFVTEDCDAGPIILQKSVPVLQDDTPEILQKRVLEQAEWVILPEAIELICNKKIEVVNNRVRYKV